MLSTVSKHARKHSCASGASLTAARRPGRVVVAPAAAAAAASRLAAPAPASPLLLGRRCQQLQQTRQRQQQTQQWRVAAVSSDAEIDVRAGDVVSGVVASIMPYGAFVDLGGGATALLHISQVSSERLESVDQVFQVGDNIRALVQSVDRQRGRIGLSTKRLEEQPGDMLRDAQRVYANADASAAAARAQRGAANAEALGSLRKGELVSGVVSGIRAFGAFVALENKGGATGLLHISQISQERVETVDDVLQVGDTVRALVQSVDRDRGRISLSTRRLEREAGDMLRDARRVFDDAEETAARLADDDDDYEDDE